MTPKEYFNSAEGQRNLVVFEDGKARLKAKRDVQYKLDEVMSEVIETNPYIGESIHMAAAYEEERQLILEEIRRNGSKH